MLFSIYPAPEFIPDSPAEPDPEPYEIVAPKVIPIDDPNEPGPVAEAEPIPANLNLPGFPLKDKLREIIQNATGGTGAEDEGEQMQMDINPNQSPPQAYSPEMEQESVPMYPPPPNGMLPPDQFFPNAGPPPPLMMGMPPPMQGMPPPPMAWGNGQMNYPPPGYPPHHMNGYQNGHIRAPRSRGGPPPNWRPRKPWHNDRHSHSDNHKDRKRKHRR